LAAFWLHVLDTARLGGKGAKVAFLTCTEAQQCTDAEAHIDEYTAELGLDLVYKAKASLLQPKFATECVRAKQAGAAYFITGLDPNGNRRVAQNCHEQDYHPRFEVPQTSSAMAGEPGLQSAYFASATFPWVSSATPAMVEFQKAMARYAPKLELSAHASSGWTSAKLFERAALGITDTPTSAQILEGLWTIKNDTLGGLTAPLTFVRDKPAPAVYCFFGMEVRAQAWVATATTPDCQGHRG
jgi:branched-chain amino acid transport system substrate-binding protein